MSTSIEVNKKSISELLKTWKDNKFVIPEYQRSYAREQEQCQTLWSDIVYFSEQHNESTYFLWTIVSYENEKWEQEIIDGQQRITTLFLLLRAIYKKLENMTENDHVKWLMKQIEPCIRDTDKITTKVEDFSKIHIKSLVISDWDNQVFSDILKQWTANDKSKDNYSHNYTFFQKKIDEYSLNDPLNFYNLCINILTNCILLPIKCDSQDTALTIFSTLNDRWLPLSDSDIFKAKLYNKLAEDQKELFIQKRQELDEVTQKADIRIQDLFYYYMFYLRAKEWDKDTTTLGLRKYFARNEYKQLYESELMEHLKQIADLWVTIIDIKNNTFQKVDRKNDIRIRQSLSCLQNYPNEFWKYPTTIFYLTYNTEWNFKEIFANFLENLLSVLCASYILEPTVNAIKGKILNLNYDILETQQPKFFIDIKSKDEIQKKLRNPHRNIIRMILEICAYRKQKELLPSKREIEHILPQKWQNTSLYWYEKKEVDPIIERIGNKIPFEKKLNILAWNNYFNMKKEEYNKSQIEITKELSKLEQADRLPTHIEERSIEIENNIIEWFDSRRAFGSENHKMIANDEEVRKIQGGENDIVEFKSSMRRSYQLSSVDKKLEHPIIKTISAFLNSRWWDLFVGVNDDGEIIWLEKDFESINKWSDGWLLHLNKLIKDCLGADKHNYINIELKELQNKELVIIKVKPSKEAVYLKYEWKEEFYIRASASSQSLWMSEAMKYIHEHRSKD